MSIPVPCTGAPDVERIRCYRESGFRLYPVPGSGSSFFNNTPLIVNPTFRSKYIFVQSFSQLDEYFSSTGGKNPKWSTILQYMPYCGKWDNNSKINLIWVQIPIAAYYSHGSIHVIKDEILSGRRNRYHSAGECRPGIRAHQNSRGIIGAPGDRKGRNLE